ncbi:FAD-dependent oxidoreductase [Candidatus Dependentiae bacterium]|nr:FAD-dependent oxidoreductase [Candidatus Dependentiae bacterium]
MKKAKKIGSVFVLGAGIGGIQASLDLADSGLKVYLAEKQSAIGGMMSQLDKTFPTNDCSMCIMSPKLVGAGRHKDIETLTNIEVLDIQGEPGNFKIKIKEKARFVDVDKCTGCGDCADVCPIEIPSIYDVGLVMINATSRLYPQAIPNAFAIEKDGISPCSNACPAGLSAQGYVALIAESRFQDAINLVRDTLPLPSICGRVCHHPCELECNRKEVDEPIAIRPLKRFIADWAISSNEELPERIIPTKSEKVAIVGAGASGLSCAKKLVELGYSVTIFDDAEYPGGMVTSCLPDYRIPINIALYDINRILALGINLEKKRIGKDIKLKDLQKEFDSTYIAIGCQTAKKLPIKGSEHKDVLYGIPFLRRVKSRENISIGERVVIIGGGNVGIDCAKSALRLGVKEVSVVCLETRDLDSKDRMPAHHWEIEEAEEEGVKILDSWGPVEIVIKNKKVSGLKLKRCTSVYTKKDKKFAPTFNEKEVTIAQADTIIIAIGQGSDLTGFEDLEFTPFKTIKVNEISLETNIKGVFAGGDIVKGPASVVDAIYYGNEAAVSIDRFLNSKSLTEDRAKLERKLAELPDREIEKMHRLDLLKRPAKIRIHDFGEIEMGYLSESEVVEEAKRCLACAICSECLQCVISCEADAIDHSMLDKFYDIDAGAVIIASGTETFDPNLKPEYGYKRYPNVLTSLEYERILSASGPFEGHIVRPSDHKQPKNIAWLQCVGSRDEKIGNTYCSSVCCMYATKEAVITKEHTHNVIDTTIFMMDMRAYGKDFDKYFERAKDEYGVKYIRNRISEVRENPRTHNLILRYETESGKLKQKEFDLVVLSVGLVAPQKSSELMKKIGVELNEYDFVKTGELYPLETSKPGIFVCGSFQSPKDIPETVAQSSGAAAQAEVLLSDVRNTLITTVELPDEIDVTGQEPQIGVFVCNCGINIGGYIDVPAVVEYASTLPGVVYAEHNLFTCSQDTQSKIKEKIHEYNLNRVVVASCTPRTHEALFQSTIREAGLNKYLFEMANIRDQCSWVHMNEPKKALIKAKELVRMAVAKAALLEPLDSIPLSVTQKALVIGGGLAGMITAIDIADQGFEVFLVEKDSKLGGYMNHLYYSIYGEDIQAYLKGIISKTKKHPLINLYLNSQVKEIEGFVGNYKTIINLPNQIPSTVEVEHGVVLVATGAEMVRTKEYHYGEDKRVVNQLELESLIIKKDKRIKQANKIFMIQCVGSRDDERPYCSRVCCSETVKNAIKIKEEYPEKEIYILYRDMRTYGFRETFFEHARKIGIVFIRYDSNKKPEVLKEAGKLKIKFYDILLEEDIFSDVDLLALAVAIEPRTDSKELSQLLKVPVNDDGFFLEAHVKLRPVDFATEGVFMLGMAHSPKFIDEAITQAHAAVARAMTIISKDKYYAEAIISRVNEELCVGCGVCVSVCNYGAIEIMDEQPSEAKQKVILHEAVCKGCGNCAAACPSGAMQQKSFKSEQLLAVIAAAFE